MSFFFFQFYFTKKYVGAAINDFTKHLIIPIWLRKQKCRQKRKIMRKRCWERRNCLWKFLIFFKYILGHTNVCFFFWNYSWVYFHLLNGVNSLHCFVWFILYTCCIFSARIASQLSHVYNHKEFLFEYMNC